jgi:hypothetical protein
MALVCLGAGRWVGAEVAEPGHTASVPAAADVTVVSAERARG